MSQTISNNESSLKQGHPRRRNAAMKGKIRKRRETERTKKQGKCKTRRREVKEFKERSQEREGSNEERRDG